MANDYLVGLKEIAEATGFSVSTVSRVIKHKGEIAPGTRERIMKVAEELGYHDNRLSIAMKTGKTGTVGVIMSLSVSFFVRLFAAVNHELVARDYLGLVAINDERSSDDRACMKQLLERRVDGIIFVPKNDCANDRYLAEITRRGLPVVAIDRKIPANIDFIGTDDFAGGYMAAEYFYSIGHRVLGYFQGPMQASPARLRREGFTDFCNRRNDCSLHIIGKGDWQVDDPALLAQELKLHPGITAVGAFSDSYAASLIEVAARIGRPVPESLAVLGFGNLADEQTNNFHISTFEQHPEELARVAVDTLFARMENADAPVKELRIKPQLTLKETTERNVP